jgi:hypothetical protein
VTKASYYWDCEKCGACNSSTKEACDSCGAPLPVSLHQSPWSRTGNSSAIQMDAQSPISYFFPEIVFALFIVFMGPIWSYRLFKRGALVQGVSFLLISLVGGYAFIKCFHNRLRWLAWLVVAAIVFSAYAVYTTLPSAP